MNRFVLAALLLSGCQSVPVEPTRNENTALIVYHPATPAPGSEIQGRHYSDRLMTADEVAALVESLPGKKIRVGHVWAPGPLLADDCGMRVIGHEVWHVLRGAWHGNVRTAVEC